MFLLKKNKTLPLKLSSGAIAGIVIGCAAPDAKEFLRIRQFFFFFRQRDLGR
jgi:hypothetical protein